MTVTEEAESETDTVLLGDTEEEEEEVVVVQTQEKGRYCSFRQFSART